MLVSSTATEFLHNLPERMGIFWCNIQAGHDEVGVLREFLINGANLEAEWMLTLI